MEPVQQSLVSCFNYVVSKLRRNEDKTMEGEQNRPSRFDITRILAPFESYLVSLQSLLMWERPYVSAVALVALNVLFWLVVSWGRRLYSQIAWFVLIVFLYRTWKYKIWPEIKVPPKEGETEMEDWTPVHLQALSVPELGFYLNSWISHGYSIGSFLFDLRQTSPGFFCLIMCTLLSLTAVIGHVIPGVLIIYILVMMASLGPGIALYVIPFGWIDHVKAIFYCIGDGLSTENTDSNKMSSGKDRSYSDTESELNDFLPERSPDILKQLSLDDESLLSDFRENDASKDSSLIAKELGMEHLHDKAECASLMLGLTNFPDVDDMNNDDSLDPFGPSSINSYIPDDKMDFVASHFKAESSESEGDDVFTKGLSFHEKDGMTESSLARPLSFRRSRPKNQHEGESSQDLAKSSLGATASSDVPDSSLLHAQNPLRKSSQGSEVDINEYEMVTEDEISS